MYDGDVKCVPVHVFFLSAAVNFIPPWWPLPFLILSKKFYVLLPTKLVSFVFNLSRSSTFSVIHVNGDIKIMSKEISSFVTLEKVHWLPLGKLPLP